MKSSSPLFFEALNETQKMITRSLCQYYFDEIDKLAPHERIEALNAIIARTVSAEEEAYFKSKDVWDNIEHLRTILSHPCPQNKAVGDYNAAIANSCFFISISEELLSGIKNGKVYYFVNGEAVREQQGLLSLTGRNDSTAPPVTKEAVVNYIYKLVNLALTENQRLAGITENRNDSIPSVMDTNKAISETNWLLCLAQDKKNPHPILYIEGIKEREAFLDQYQIVSNPVRSILVGHRPISRMPRKYNGEKGVFQLFEINAEEGVSFKNSLKSEIKNYAGTLNIFSREISAVFMGDTAEESLAWVVNKLKKINIVVDTSIFTAKNESDCLVM